MADWEAPPLVPGKDNDSSIGYANRRWKDIYAVNLHGELDGNAKTATAATTATKAAEATEALSGMGMSVVNGMLCYTWEE